MNADGFCGKRREQDAQQNGRQDPLGHATFAIHPFRDAYHEGPQQKQHDGDINERHKQSTGCAAGVCRDADNERQQAPRRDIVDGSAG